jgi:UDP-2,3-diacylglucosamine pyrophosphatase LpxH
VVRENKSTMSLAEPISVDPCPAEIELRLAAGGRLAFVSDLHLAVPPFDDFDATTELCELAVSLQEHPGEVILVLGGDVLDLLQVQAPRGEQAAMILASPTAAAAGEAVRQLAARPGTTVVYLVGNHDAALAWDGRSRALVAGHFGARHVALRAHVTVEGPGGGEVRLVAEHGDVLDRYNRRTDPFDPLDVPPGDHIVTEVVNRLEATSQRFPRLGLDQVDNVRPALMIPLWLVSSFFYRYMSQALRAFVVPLVALWAIVHLVATALVASDLYGLADLGNRAVRWTASVVLADLVLLLVLSTFLGRTFRRAAGAYSLPSPDEAHRETASRRAGVPALLDLRDPLASVLVTGHSHEPELVSFPDGRVAVDAGCWVRGLVPVTARFSMPPVFVPAYPVNWVEVRSAGDRVTVALWQRRLAVERRRLELLEWLAAKRPLPSPEAEPPRVVAEVAVTPRTVPASRQAG